MTQSVLWLKGFRMESPWCTGMTPVAPGKDSESEAFVFCPAGGGEGPAATPPDVSRVETHSILQQCREGDTSITSILYGKNGNREVK